MKQEMDTFQNFYKLKEVEKHNVEIPNPHYHRTLIKLLSRWIIVGGTGTGKTNIVLNYLMRTPDIYDGIVVVNAGVDEPLYKCLEEKMKDNGNLVFFTLDTFPTYDEFKAKKPEKHHYLIIMDDLMGELSASPKKMAKIEPFFTRGRKIFVDVIFLTQSFFKVAKTFRNQANYVSLLKLNSKRDLAAIVSDYTLGVTQAQLIDMYTKATEQPLHSLKIDINATDLDHKFCRDFNDPFDIQVRHDPRDGAEYSIVRPGPWYKPPPRDVDHLTRKRKSSDYSSVFELFNR